MNQEVSYLHVNVSLKKSAILLNATNFASVTSNFVCTHLYGIYNTMTTFGDGFQISTWLTSSLCKGWQFVPAIKC